MSCTNCFNGCSEITSDKCVKYTGADIPALGIQNGDTLEFVEQTLAQFLISTYCRLRRSLLNSSK
jgi:hypothetical protein